MKREEMPWLKAFLHDALMNEHSVGFSLKRIFSLIGDGRLQALTVKEGAIFLASTRVAPRDKIYDSRPFVIS